MAITSRRTSAVGAAIAAAATVGFLAAGCSSRSGTAVPNPGTTPPATSTTTTGPASPTGSSSSPPASPPNASTGASAGGSDGGHVHPCLTAHLKVTMGAVHGAAGHRISPLQLTNTGQAPCFMKGFPGVSYVESPEGSPVGKPAGRVGGTGNRVVLQPGQTASASLDEVQVRNFDTDVCKPERTSGLRVYPPNNTASLFVRQTGVWACTNPNIPGDQLQIKAVAPGTGGA